MTIILPENYINNKKIVKVFTPIARTDFSYWSTVFVSIIACLHEHKVIENSPRKMIGDNWSLNDYRGKLPNNAFKNIEKGIKNFGAQYFMALLYNLKGSPIRSELEKYLKEIIVDNLRDKRKANEFEIKSSCCIVSGIDSHTGATFLKKCGYRIINDLRKRVKTSPKLTKHTDLCILIEHKSREHTVIFGEVEGNKGRRLLSNKYWEQKDNASLFGIGCCELRGNTYEIHPIENRFVLLIHTERTVLRDYSIAMSWISLLLTNGPLDKDFSERVDKECLDAVKDVVRLIVDNYDKPVSY